MKSGEQSFVRGPHLRLQEIEFWSNDGVHGIPGIKGVCANKWMAFKLVASNVSLNKSL